LQKILTEIFNEIENNPYTIKRQQVRFRNIILLFKELAKFNSKKLNDIITDAGFDLQFKIEFENKGIIYNDIVVKRKVDETFANFLSDFDNYVSAFERTLNNKVTNSNKPKMTRERSAIKDLENQIENIDKEIQRLGVEAGYNAPGSPEFAQIQTRINNLNQQKGILITQLNALDSVNYITDAEKRRSMSKSQETNRINYLNAELAAINNKKTQLLAAGVPLNDPRIKRLENRENAIKAEIQNIENTNNLYPADNDPFNFNLDQKFKYQTAEYAGNDKFGVPFRLEDAKTELGELYRTLYRNLTNETILTSYLNVLCKEGIDENTFIKINNEYRQNSFTVGTDEYVIGQFVNDMYLDVVTIVDVLIEKVKADFESKLQAMSAANASVSDDKLSFFERLKRVLNIINKEWDQYRDNMIKAAIRFLINRVLKVICRFVERDVRKGEVNFKETVKGIHPLLAKLARNPNNFKSFIFGFDMMMNLYDLFYLTELQKYYAGWSIYQRPLIDLPMKYKNPKNKIDYILTDIFKIDQNPLWIVGNRELYLTLPDYMSLIRSKIFTKVPKDKIKNYCKINYEKIMSERNMGKILMDKDQGEMIQDLRKKVSRLESINILVSYES